MFGTGLKQPFINDLHTTIYVVCELVSAQWLLTQATTPIPGQGRFS